MADRIIIVKTDNGPEAGTAANPWVVEVGTDTSSAGGGTVNVNTVTATSPLPINIATSTTQTPVIINLNTNTAGTPGLININTITATAPLPISGSISSVNAVVSGSLSSVFTQEIKPTTTSITAVSATVGSIQVLAANANRKMASIFAESTATVYVKLGTGASATSYTVKMETDDYFELPFPIYSGVIQASWSSTSGALRVTEYT